MGEEVKLVFEEFLEIGFVKVEWLWEFIGELIDCKIYLLYVFLNN